MKFMNSDTAYAFKSKGSTCPVSLHVYHFEAVRYSTNAFRTVLKAVQCNWNAHGTVIEAVQRSTTTQLQLVQHSTNLFNFLLHILEFENSETICGSAPIEMSRLFPETLTYHPSTRIMFLVLGPGLLPSL